MSGAGCALVVTIISEDGFAQVVWTDLFFEWLLLALLEGCYFVNAASLLMLGSILEKNKRNTCPGTSTSSHLIFF